ncbi:MAG: CbbQ/NirQ/NorQ/GpvN family protein [Alphaproteobacteria bacterium]|nr:CbbQ/NirQ/NorQ/GpvN family protein [Alphaproteobacteria bacterium]
MSSLPWYRPTGDELDVFRAAASLRLPVLLKGPTGCGKSRFVRHMAAVLGRSLVTVACQEDLAAADLTGRYVLEGGETVWRDGPLTRAVREGAIVYLDEVVEARADVLTVLHPLTDDRRVLPLDRTGEELVAPDDFLVVISYNPGYQSVTRELKESTRQRFVSLSFDYPAADVEAEIVAHESGCDEHTAGRLVELGRATRQLRSHGLKEGASTRLLVYAAQLVVGGLPLRQACEVTLVGSLTDDADMTRSLRELLRSVLG